MKQPRLIGIVALTALLFNVINAITDLPRMAELATDMLHRALEAFVVADAAVATQIPKECEKKRGDRLHNVRM